MTTEEVSRQWAQEKAEARYGFRWRAFVYAVINLLLIAIWYYSGPGFPWFLFSLGEWRIGLIAHYFRAYGSVGEEWIERETERILEEEQRRG